MNKIVTIKSHTKVEIEVILLFFLITILLFYYGLIKFQSRNNTNERY